MRGKRLNRLLKLIAILRGPTGWNARKLSEHYGISRRNVYRDVAVLELAGIPVYHDGDYCDGGAYRIREGFWFPNISVTDDECLDLSVLTRIAESQIVPLLDSASEVRDKLLGTLPAKQQNIITEAAELFDILSVGLADHSKCRKIMRAIQQALMTQKQISGTYSSPHERRTVTVDLQPRRVFLSSMGNTWYLAAHDNKDGKTKVYRLARFAEVKVLDKPMLVSRNWSLRAFLGNAWTVYRGDRDYQIEIQFDADAAPLIEEVKWHPTQEIERQKNGSIIFTATVSGLEEIKGWVLSWGPKATVLKPKELVNEVSRLAEEIVNTYHTAAGRQQPTNPAKIKPKRSRL